MSGCRAICRRNWTSCWPATTWPSPSKTSRSPSSRPTRSGSPTGSAAAPRSAYWGPLAVDAEVPHAEIAAKSSPQTLSLRRLWTCKELKKPGNILVLDADGKTPRILVFDGAQAIAEIDPRGKVVKQHPVQQHEGEIIAQLRLPPPTRAATAGLPPPAAAPSKSISSTPTSSSCSAIRPTPWKIRTRASPISSWPTWTATAASTCW